MADRFPSGRLGFVFGTRRQSVALDLNFLIQLLPSFALPSDSFSIAPGEDPEHLDAILSSIWFPYGTLDMCYGFPGTVYFFFCAHLAANTWKTWNVLRERCRFVPFVDGQKAGGTLVYTIVALGPFWFPPCPWSFSAPSMVCGFLLCFLLPASFR